MEESELRKLQVEAWKTTVQVQQHFNDIEMRIRALAITVLTAVLGAAALAVRNETTLHVLGTRIDLGGVLVVIGLIAWLLFYFVDNWWYHRLLLGSVAHGVAVEKLLEEGGVQGFGLTTAIGDASPFMFTLRVPKTQAKWQREVHSTTKARLFYFIIAVILAVVAGFLFANKATAATPKNPPPAKNPVTTPTTSTSSTSTTSG